MDCPQIHRTHTETNLTRLVWVSWIDDVFHIGRGEREADGGLRDARMPRKAHDDCRGAYKILARGFNTQAFGMKFERSSTLPIHSQRCKHDCILILNNYTSNDYVITT